MKMKKILIIDDESEAVDLLKNFLVPRGYKVVTAFDGEEGLKKFDSEDPDIILCDIKMPKKGGLKLINELRSSRRWVPIIIVSALNEPVDIMKGYDCEAEHYITKPLNLDNVLKSIQTMLTISHAAR